MDHKCQLACACGAQEAAARGEAAALRAEVADLSRLVEAGTGLSAGEETARDELLRQRDALLAEHDAQARATLHAAASRTHGHACILSTS